MKWPWSRRSEDGPRSVEDATEALLGAQPEQAPPAEFTQDKPEHSWATELYELLCLTAAIFVSRVSWVVIKTTDSALL
eukprot:scaffold57455_cov35-Prasinocladus_malaysianus.AAC.1